MSAGTATAFPPRATISSATASTSSVAISFSTKLAPAAASASASARPSPLPAPVTIAALPSRLSASSIAESSFSVAGPGQQAAVGDELGAGRIGRLVGGEVGDQAGDLGRAGEPGQRHGRQEGLAVRRVRGSGLAEGHAGEDPAGMYGVDPDAELAEFLGG